jgi:hypothetical protein
VYVCPEDHRSSTELQDDHLLGSSAEGYGVYVNQLRSLVAAAGAGWTGSLADEVAGALDGQAAEALRAQVSIGVRREKGQFFTTSALRRRLHQLSGGRLSGPFFDPACGAGDLLLFAAEMLDLKDSLAETLDYWSGQLAGFDLEPEFVEAARARLHLAAVQRHNSLVESQRRPSETVSVEPVEVFDGLKVGDGQEGVAELSGAATVLLNPPYGLQAAPLDCDWGSGKVPRAAVWVESVLHKMPIGGRLVAILPDSLRSGSRSGRWRIAISKLMEVNLVAPVGQFDPWTDVDVFILMGQRRDRLQGESAFEWPQPGSDLDNAKRPVVGDLFEVRVGPVVHFRDPLEGPERNFLTARLLRSWRNGTGELELRRFKGRTFRPPFVAIRRTDRPSATNVRCEGFVITGEGDVAVENHVIVLSPLDGAVETCRRLVSRLSDRAVSAWLDDRIRCRHLTVSAVKEIPLD